MSAALKCPDDATLRLLLLGRLTDDAMEPLGSHLLACPDCTARADTVDVADALTVSLSEISTVDNPDDPLARQLSSRMYQLGALPRPFDAEATSVDVPPAASQTGPFPFLAPAAASDELGRLGGYRILKVLGQGGMGVVFQAEDTRLARRCALKVMLPEVTAKQGMKERFLREARAAAQIEHDQIIPIFQVDEDRGVPFIAMPLLKGCSLEDWLRQQASGGRQPRGASPTDIPTILNIGRQVAEGLAAAHEGGLIHRDIKPANIWLEESRDKSPESRARTEPFSSSALVSRLSTLDFRVKILDFGLARLSEAAGDEQLTQSGAILGTPGYLAPEQARGETLDGRADLFSLGVILYRLCTGEMPFQGKDTLSTLLALATYNPPPPHKVNPAIGQPLSKLVMKLLAKERDDRVGTACELIEAIDALKSQPDKAAQTAMIASPLQKSLAIVVVLLALAGLSWFLGPGIYRFVTNQGQLVIETDDPNIEITVRGNQVRVVDVKTGGQINLQAGRYQAELTKGKGLQLLTSEFTLSRGGRQVVRVRVSSAPAAASDDTPLLSADREPFLVLARNGERKKRHANLPEAIAAAASGDTIEIRGNGPFLIPPIKIAHRLHLRSGAGFRPVIKISPEAQVTRALIETYAPLILEGLEFQWLDPATKARTRWFQLINASNALYAANCRFVTRNVEVHLAGVGPHLTDARNCEFLSPPGYVRSDGSAGYTNVTQTWPGRRVVLNNCLLTARIFLALQLADPKGAVFQLTNSTWRSPHSVAFSISTDNGDAKEIADADWRVKSLDVHASGNVFDAGAVLLFGAGNKTKDTLPGEAEALLAQIAHWQGERNVYTADAGLLSLARSVPTLTFLPAKLPPGLAGWKQFWDTQEQGSLEGQISFRGGAVPTATELDLERITPDDFRLLPGSAGYRAGQDGKDLGANVDLVGPGPAYERWKQTPQYQEWLQETGQSK